MKFYNQPEYSFHSPWKLEPKALAHLRYELHDIDLLLALLQSDLHHHTSYQVK